MEELIAVTIVLLHDRFGTVRKQSFWLCAVNEFAIGDFDTLQLGMGIFGFRDALVESPFHFPSSIMLRHPRGEMAGVRNELRGGKSNRCLGRDAKQFELGV